MRFKQCLQIMLIHSLANTETQIIHKYGNEQNDNSNSVRFMQTKFTNYVQFLVKQMYNR